jgi:hypothetical protein
MGNEEKRMVFWNNLNGRGFTSGGAEIREGVAEMRGRRHLRGVAEILDSAVDLWKYRHQCPFD